MSLQLHSTTFLSFMHMGILSRTSDLIIVIVVIQTATFLKWHTAPSLEDKPWFAEAATDTGARTVGGGFHTGGDTSRTTVNILCIRRAWFCTAERNSNNWLMKNRENKYKKERKKERQK